MKNTLIRATLLGAAMGAALLAPAMAAPPMGGSHPMVNPPITTPVGRPSTPGDTDRGMSGTTKNGRENGHVVISTKRNRKALGKPASHGDTDRGRSEGKGRNDRMHRNHRAQRGSVVSVSGNAVVIRLANGKLETVTVTNPTTFVVGQTVNFKIWNGVARLIGTKPKS